MIKLLTACHYVIANKPMGGDVNTNKNGMAPIHPTNKNGSFKIDRLQERANRLQKEAQQARERLREEETTQQKIARLLERRRIESEQRYLGLLAWSAGLQKFRMEWSDALGNPINALDWDLLTGAMDLLQSQLQLLKNEEELARLRERGQELRLAYFENRDNPKFRIPLVGIPINENKKTGGKL